MDQHQLVRILVQSFLGGFEETAHTDVDRELLDSWFHEILDGTLKPRDVIQRVSYRRNGIAIKGIGERDQHRLGAIIDCLIGLKEMCNVQD